MNTELLTDVALDFAVAKCEGTLPHSFDDWKQTWPRYGTERAGDDIIDRELIGTRITTMCGDYAWEAEFSPAEGQSFGAYGATRREAAMRCYVASKLGADVEIPKELL